MGTHSLTVLCLLFSSEASFFLGEWKHVSLQGRKGDKTEIKNCHHCLVNIVCSPEWGLAGERDCGSGRDREKGAERWEQGELGEQRPCLRAWWVWAPSQAASGRRPMGWWKGLKKRAPCAEVQAGPRRERASSSGGAKGRQAGACSCKRYQKQSSMCAALAESRWVTCPVVLNQGWGHLVPAVCLPAILPSHNLC